MKFHIFYFGLFLSGAIIPVYGQDTAFTIDEEQKIYQTLRNAAKDYYLAMLDFKYDRPLKAQQKIAKEEKVVPLFISEELKKLYLFNDLDARKVTDYYPASEYFETLTSSEKIDIAFDNSIRVDKVHAYNTGIRFETIGKLDDNLSYAKVDRQTAYYINTVFIRNFSRTAIGTANQIKRRNEQIVVCWQYTPRRNKNGKLLLSKSDFLIIGTLPFKTFAHPDHNRQRVQDLTALELPRKPGKNDGVEDNTDTDLDGVLDINDHCPEVPGPAMAGGCPDQDGDTVGDWEDQCPEVAGSETAEGCPDMDRDGVADEADECPDLPGLRRFTGCPDSDYDGIIDTKDDCPERVGPESNAGCPFATSIEGIGFRQAQAQLNEDGPAMAKALLNAIKYFLSGELDSLPEPGNLFLGDGENVIIRITNHESNRYERIVGVQEYWKHLGALRQFYDDIRFDFHLQLEEELRPWQIDGSYFGSLTFTQDFYGIGPTSYCDQTLKTIKFDITESGMRIREIWHETTERISPCE
jgi:hypothetical protein